VAPSLLSPLYRPGWRGPACGRNAGVGAGGADADGGLPVAEFLGTMRGMEALAWRGRYWLGLSIAGAAAALILANLIQLGRPR
jgi:hypothetical protein